MPMKSTGSGSTWRTIDDWADGVGWIAHPDETMQRASHALVDGDDVWLVDPLDVDGLDELLADRGEVRGVVILLDRHKRDAEPLARRYDVPVYVPEWMDDVRDELDVPVEPIRRGLPDSSYDLHKLVDNPFWKEGYLYDESAKTLMVAEAVGTTSYFRTGGERLGVHPALRMKPPKTLKRFAPERIRVGHGDGVSTDAQSALADAIDGSRRRTPRLYAQTVRNLLS